MFEEKIEVEQEFDEYEIIYLMPKDYQMSFIQYPMRSKSIDFDKYLSLNQMNIKSQQKQLEMIYRINRNFDNYDMSQQSNENIKFNSKFIENRTNYCVCKIDHVTKKFYLIPVSQTYQMKKCFKDQYQKQQYNQSNAQNIENEKEKQADVMIKKRDFSKHLDSYLRQYKFQQEIFNSEDYQKIDFYHKKQHQSDRFLDSILSFPKSIKKPNTLKNKEYINMLIGS